MPDVSVELCDKAFNRLGWLNDHAQLTANYRHNRRSAATITLAADHIRVPQLMAAGARVVITYTPDGGAPMHLSGRIGSVQAQGPRGASTVVATVLGDWVDEVLAWPIPGAPLSAQDTADYWVGSGAAETVIKAIVGANGSRIGKPWTMATDLGRGSTVKISARMVPLSDVVEPAAEAGGIGVRMAQVPGGSTIVVDAYVGADRTTRVLSEDSGSVTAWSLTVNAPTGTDSVVGLDGELKGRNFVHAANPVDRAAWGAFEVFIDARDLSVGGEGIKRGEDVLMTEMAPTYALVATLSETPTWRAGVNLNLGDLVAISPFPGITYTERVRELVVTSSPADGIVAQPVVGDPDATDPTRATVARVRAIARAVRNLRAR